MPKDVPEGQWQDLAADFFQHNNTKYLLITDTFSKYPFLYKISSKAAELITQRIKSLISQYGPPKPLSIDNGPPFSSDTFAQFMQKEHIDHITSSPHYPKSNRFIKQQIKTIKTALSTCQEAKLPIKDLLLNIRTETIGPHLPSPREILLNRTEECPGRPYHPVDMENICNYLISKKAMKKEIMTKVTKPEHYQASFQVRKQNPHQYIEGTITAHASTPRSYFIESHGRNYCHNHQHIPLHTPIPRPSATVEQPDFHINSTIPGPSTTTQSPLNVKPTNSGPLAPKPIPAPHCKFLSRPPEQSPTCATTTNLNQILAHLTAINQLQTTMLVEHKVPVHENLSQESSPSSPGTSTTTTSETEETSLDMTTSDETLSTSSDSSTTSTTSSDRQLRPMYPINYSEKLLTKLHGIAQIRTFNNISTLLPTTNT